MQNEPIYRTYYHFIYGIIETEACYLCLSTKILKALQFNLYKLKSADYIALDIIVVKLLSNCYVLVTLCTSHIYSPIKPHEDVTPCCR